MPRNNHNKNKTEQKQQQQMAEKKLKKNSVGDWEKPIVVVTTLWIWLPWIADGFCKTFLKKVIDKFTEFNLHTYIHSFIAQNDYGLLKS